MSVVLVSSQVCLTVVMTQYERMLVYETDVILRSAFKREKIRVVLIYSIFAVSYVIRFSTIISTANEAAKVKFSGPVSFPAMCGLIWWGFGVDLLPVALLLLIHRVNFLGTQQQ